MEFIEVPKETFHDFYGYADKHVEGLRNEAVMIADRLNTKNSNNELIAYISVWGEEIYYVRADYLDAFNNCPEDERYRKELALNYDEYTALRDEMANKQETAPMITRARAAGIDPLGKMKCRIDYETGTYTIIEG